MTTAPSSAGSPPPLPRPSPTFRARPRQAATPSTSPAADRSRRTPMSPARPRGCSGWRWASSPTVPPNGWSWPRCWPSRPAGSGPWRAPTGGPSPCSASSPATRSSSRRSTCWPRPSSGAGARRGQPRRREGGSRVTEERGGRRRVLFVCEHDGGASRMCAAYLAREAGDRYEAGAAGREGAAGVRLEAASALSEDRVPVVDGPGTELTPELAAAVDRIVTLGFTLNPDVARDVPREEWGIPSPAGRPAVEVRVIRDTIRRLIERLVARLDTEAAVR